MYVCIILVLCIIASDLLFHDFNKTFNGQIINPNDLIIKEQISEGECQISSYNYILIHAIYVY